jgi:hypothetical protein
VKLYALDLDGEMWVAGYYHGIFIFICVNVDTTHPQFMAYVMTNSLSSFTVLTNANGLCQKRIHP